MPDQLRSSPAPQTPEEIAENFGKAITLFQEHCGGNISTVDEANAYLTNGLTFLPGSYQGANVRLYPPNERMAKIIPAKAFPKLFFNAGDDQAFKRLSDIFKAADMTITIENIR